MTNHSHIPTPASRCFQRPGLLRRAVRACVLSCVAIVGVFAVANPAQGQVLLDEPPKEIRGLEVENHLGRTLPLDLLVRNEKGDEVKLGSYFNKPASDGKSKKPVVMMMVYYRCPMLCPLVLEKFGTALGEIDFTVGLDYDAVVVSFDPRDTYKDAAVQQKARVIAYGREDKGGEGGAEKVAAGWNFLTATPQNARALGDALGFPYRQIPETGEYAHGACVFVITPEGKISRYLTGLNYPSKDVRLALLDASGGKIGNIFDAVTLWCYHYDPNAGSYSVQAMRIMRIGAALMTIFVASVLFAMLRIEKSKKRRASLASAAASHVDAGPGATGRSSAVITGHTS